MENKSKNTAEKWRFSLGFLALYVFKNGNQVRFSKKGKGREIQFGLIVSYVNSSSWRGTLLWEYTQFLPFPS